MKGMLPMTTKKQNIIERIENLSEEQFELLIALYSLQEQESAPIVPIGNPSYFQPAV